MARQPPYRRSTGQPAQAPPTVRRYLLPIVGFLGILIAIMAITGNALGDVLLVWFHGVWLLPILLPAAMLGLALTAPLAAQEDHGPLAASSWPQAYRLILSIALGLGTLSLVMLGLGSLGLLGYGIPIVALIAAASVGAVPAWRFFRTFGRDVFAAPVGRADLVILLACVPLAVLGIAVTMHPGLLWASEGRGYDVLEYHLQTPREYLANHATAPLAHNVYSYLPANVEMLYLLLMSLTRLGFGPAYVLQAVYPAQMLHALLTVLAAAAVALAPVRLTAVGRMLAFVLMLAVPWTLVIGSLAYNDGAVLLYGALALTLALGTVAMTPSRQKTYATILLGALLGLAVGCKLTAGPMFAIPVAAVLLAQRRWRDLALATALALACYAPWALRAAAATGNPVFPLATSVLGRGPWTPAQTQRWDKGHAAHPNYAGFTGHLHALANESVLNPQWSTSYAAIDRWTETPNRPDVPREPPPWWQRIGFLWLVIPLALVLAASRGPVAWQLLAVGALQVGFWLTLTHLQARFLLPLLVPLGLLVALGAEVLTGARVIIGTVIALQAMLTPFVLIDDLRARGLARAEYPDAVGFALKHPEALRYPDSLLPSPPDAPPPHLPDNIGVLLVGDSRALYYHGRVHYHTVFDRNLLAEHLRADKPNQVINWLMQEGIDYVVVDWSEVDRLAKTYGYEPEITPPAFDALAAAGLEELPTPPRSPIRIYHVK